jgi:hypothetical protein
MEPVDIRTNKYHITYKPPGPTRIYEFKEGKEVEVHLTNGYLWPVLAFLGSSKESINGTCETFFLKMSLGERIVHDIFRDITYFA